MSLYLRLLSYVKPYWKSTVVTLIAMLVVSVGNLVPTWIAGRIVIDGVIVQRDVSRLHWIALLLLGVYLIKSIGVMLAEWLSHEIAEKIIYDMRTQIYSHLQKLSFRFHKDSTTGDLMSRVVNDIDAMRDMLAHTVHIFTVQALTFIGIAIILSVMHLKMAILTLVPILILGPLIVHFGIKLRLISRDVRAELAEVNARLQDNLSGIFEIQAFAREPYEEKRFIARCADYRNSIIRGIRLWARLNPAVQFLLGASYTAILWYGGWQIISGTSDMTVGELFIFLGYLWQLFMPIQMASHENERLQKALAAGERMMELLDTAPEIKDLPNAWTGKVKGELLFEDVSFRYTEEDVLTDVNLKIRPGETIAFVGPSGVGNRFRRSQWCRQNDVGRPCAEILRCNRRTGKD